MKLLKHTTGLANLIIISDISDFQNFEIIPSQNMDIALLSINSKLSTENFRLPNKSYKYLGLNFSIAKSDLTKIFDLPTTAEFNDLIKSLFIDTSKQFITFYSNQI